MAVSQLVAEQHAQASQGAVLREAASESASQGAIHIDSKLWAMKKFAESRNMAESEVDWEMVRTSTEGVQFWLAKDIDLRARSALSQKFARAIAHDDVANAMYKDLSQDLQRQFRASWAISRTFSFIRESRKITSRHTQKDADVGEYLTEMQIRSKLGGVDNEVATQHAASYVEKCKLLKGVWMAYNTWVDDWTYLFSSRFITSSNERMCEEISEHYDNVNTWEEHHMQCKARRAYAAFKKVHMDKVTIEEVEQTSLGIKGWADVVHTVSATSVGGKSQEKLSNKAKSSGSGSTAPAAKRVSMVGKPSDSISVAERVAKQVISRELVLEKQYKSLAQQMTAEAESWTWAENFIDELKNKRSEYEQLLTSFEGSFPDKLKAAVLSPNLMKGLRKETGTHWHSKLCAFVEGAERRLDEIEVAYKNIHNMNHAKNHPYETPRKAKKANSCERTK